MMNKRLKRPVELDGIMFDALISQDENYSADAPDYPVESGYKIHDSVLLNALEIRTTLYLSNSPITWSSVIGRSASRVQDVEEQLRELFWSQEPVTYITSDRSYRNMCITSLTISKTQEDGYARQIPITLKQVEITSTKTAVVPDSYARGGKTEASAGTASTRAASEGVASESSSAGSTESQQSQQKASILYKASKGLGLIK